ncbi:MAG TPA: PfkB family carbohydrate kinase [Syntrophomonadaceae bacterium]|nr:PfkB family carbohydrate kinase [Syntrophomonadaceae bacterium]HNX28981.1 PfkB family carbohydrate kinase [Syntrophomonadaceae bacterium]HPR93737.1 PfkB family carbohydrate kinase [Syntrophomonadaceae bacterium]
MGLTVRETEILELLKKEPLISQVELADRLGITRSSVAVHISNLMKKGVILGKGYVFNQEASIVVFGECSMRIDISEQPENRIDMHLGGFAFEAARAFSELSVQSKVVTVVGKDQLGDYIIDKMQESKTDVSNVFRNHGSRSSRTVYINGALTYQEKIAATDYEKAADTWEWIFLNSDWLMIDPSLPEGIFNKIMSRNDEKMPLIGTCKYIDGVSEIPAVYTQTSLLVIGLENSENIDYYSRKMLDLVKTNHTSCIITDGCTGLLYMDAETTIDFPLMPAQSFSVINRLPFLLAGMIYGLARRYPTRQAVRIAVGTASTNEAS